MIPEPIRVTASFVLARSKIEWRREHHKPGARAPGATGVIMLGRHRNSGRTVDPQVDTGKRLIHEGLAISA
jgi:hypothetical protein